MKVILTTNIKKLGKVGVLINVKNGFARNFLFPQNKALRNTKSNKEYFDKIRDEIIAKETKKKDEALKLLNNIKKNINQNEQIIRHLFVKVKNHQDLPTKILKEEKQ